MVAINFGRPEGVLRHDLLQEAVHGLEQKYITPDPNPVASRLFHQAQPRQMSHADEVLWETYRDLMVATQDTAEMRRLTAEFMTQI